jgi:hypothetical protein
MKWRFLLSVASVVLALFLWRVGLWEFLSMIQQHHHGKHYHVPLAQAVSYTINSPALVLSNFVDNLVVRDLDWDERWFHYGTIEYYISVFALWWCIGSRIDRKPGPLKHTILWSIACFIGICFSLLLVYGGIMVREIEIEYETTAVPISMVLWGLGLSLYFGKELRQLYVLRVRRA